MARGDHICVKRFLYCHHGIDCGDGSVIHYTGNPWQRKNALITRDSLENFAKGAPLRIVTYTPQPAEDEVLQRAEERLNETRYSLLFNNCEHFARYCMTGLPESKQVKTIFKTAFVTSTLVLIGGVLTVVRRSRGQRG